MSGAQGSGSRASAAWVVRAVGTGAFGRALVVGLAALVVAAVAVLLLVPASHSVALLDIGALPPGPQLSDGPVFTYYDNASLESRAGDDGGRVLECRIRSADGWTGFGMVTEAQPGEGAALYLRWRCTGTAPHIQVDLQERGAGPGGPAGEVFSAMVPFVFGQWVTTPLPLKNLVRNENYQPAGAALDGALDVTRLGSLSFTLPPHSDMTIEIAEATFGWPGIKWQLFGGIGLGIFVLLAALVTQLTLRRVRAEHTLAVSEANYHAIFDAVGEGILVVDPAAGVILDANRAAGELLQVAGGPLAGRPFADVAGELDASADAEAANGSPGRREHGWVRPLRRADGGEAWIEVRVTPTRIGEAPRLLVVLRDVTERTAAERERLRLEQRLVHSQKMEALGQLAGGVAHDFNNLLTGITLATDGALRRVADPAAVSAGLAQVIELSSRAAELTQQMLTFSRRHPVKPVPLHLNTLVVGALSMLRRLIGEDVRVTFTAGTDLDLIRGDRGQIEQLLVNLAVNARDAMAGGGDLGIATFAAAPGPESSDGAAGRRHIVLAVSDTGHGIDAAIRERIFEPFFTTKETGKGTGLGLAMVYGISKRHGATIAVDSEVGKGSTFRIAFPLLEASEEPVAGAVAVPREAPGGDELIMVVEDNDDVRALLEDVLGGLGYRVLSADCPAKAEPICRARRREIGLLLSDVVMPGESGPQFYHRMAREEPGLKVVFMSGYADAPGCEEVVREGLPFIQKPFATSDLARLIRETLDGSPPRDAPPS